MGGPEMLRGARTPISVSLFKPLCVDNRHEGQWYATISDGDTTVRVTQWPLQHQELSSERGTPLCIELFIADSDFHFSRGQCRKFAELHIPVGKIFDEHGGALFRGWFGLRPAHDGGAMEKHHGHPPFVSAECAGDNFHAAVALAGSLWVPKVCCTITDHALASHVAQPPSPQQDRWEAALRRSVTQHGNIVAQMHRQLQALRFEGRLLSSDEHILAAGSGGASVEGAAFWSGGLGGDQTVEQMQIEVQRLTEALKEMTMQLSNSDRAAMTHYHASLAYRQRLEQFTQDLPQVDEVDWHPRGLTDCSDFGTQVEGSKPGAEVIERPERSRLADQSQASLVQLHGLRLSDKELRLKNTALQQERDEAFSNKIQMEAHVGVLKDELRQKTSELIDAWAREGQKAQDTDVSAPSNEEDRLRQDLCELEARFRIELSDKEKQLELAWNSEQKQHDMALGELAQANSVGRRLRAQMKDLKQQQCEVESSKAALAMSEVAASEVAAREQEISELRSELADMKLTSCSIPSSPSQRLTFEQAQEVERLRSALQAVAAQAEEIAAERDEMQLRNRQMEKHLEDEREELTRLKAEMSLTEESLHQQIRLLRAEIRDLEEANESLQNQAQIHFDNVESLQANLAGEILAVQNAANNIEACEAPVVPQATSPTAFDIRERDLGGELLIEKASFHREVSQIGACKLGHNLQSCSSSHQGDWICDGYQEPEGCRSGITDPLKSAGLERFRCDVCDYDLCRLCLAVQLHGCRADNGLSVQGVDVSCGLVVEEQDDLINKIGTLIDVLEGQDHDRSSSQLAPKVQPSAEETKELHERCVRLGTENTVLRGKLGSLEEQIRSQGGGGGRMDAQTRATLQEELQKARIAFSASKPQPGTEVRFSASAHAPVAQRDRSSGPVHGMDSDPMSGVLHTPHPQTTPTQRQRGVQQATPTRCGLGTRVEIGSPQSLRRTVPARDRRGSLPSSGRERSASPTVGGASVCKRRGGSFFGGSFSARPNY